MFLFSQLCLRGSKANLCQPQLLIPSLFPFPVPFFQDPFSLPQTGAFVLPQFPSWPGRTGPAKPQFLKLEHANGSFQYPFDLCKLQAPVLPSALPAKPRGSHRYFHREFWPSTQSSSLPSWKTNPWQGMGQQIHGKGWMMGLQIHGKG